MKFIEASKLKVRTIFILPEFVSDFMINDYLYFEKGTVYDQNHSTQHCSVELYTTDWEIINEKKD